MTEKEKAAFEAFYVYCAEEMETARQQSIRKALAPFIPRDAHPGAVSAAETAIRSRVIDACNADKKFLRKTDALYFQWKKGAFMRLIAKRERPLIAKFAKQVGKDTFGGPTVLDRFRRLFRWVSVSKVQGGV